MSNIWFTSDTHFHHKNIVRGTSEWEIDLESKLGLQRLRDFDTLEEHDAKLVENFNKVVKEDDTLYHLGDWSFGGIDQIWNFRKQLRCKNVHHILGNHDHHIENDRALRVPASERAIMLNLNIVDDVTKRFDGWSFPNARSLFSSVQHYKEISVHGQRIILSHYAMRVWNKSHQGSWMLYGHSHGTLDEMKPEFANPTWIGDMYYIKNYKTMDVGVDTNNLMPYSFEQIRDKFKNKEVLLGVDHHSKDTN